ncbi:MAG: signal peptidase I [Hyphomicrobiales bacterium]
MTTHDENAPRKRSRLFLLLLLLCIPGLILTGILLFVLKDYRMPSASNVPNLVIGDYFFANRLAYVTADPQRGDMTVFKKPNDPGVDHVKRVIGLPGDRIQMKDGRLILNGTLVERVPEALDTKLPDTDGLTFYRETLPGGRSYAIAEVSDNAGADNTPEYVVPEGAYFVLGDNRDNSQDSRFLDEVGYVPRGNFTGRYSFRFWNSTGVPLSGRPAEHG